MLIGVIADTHMNKNISRLEYFLSRYLSQVELIIHAGDYVSEESLEIIKSFRRFIGVYGNNDCDRIKNILKEKEIVELYGHRIGIFHGHGQSKTTIDRSYEIFENENTDIVIFGHSHKPSIIISNKTIMINPGSPTNKRKEKMYSYVIIDIEQSNINICLNFFNI